MRRRALLSLFVLLTTTPACSEILYARPDAGAADSRYRWSDEIVRDSVPLAAALAWTLAGLCWRAGTRHYQGAGG